MAGTVTPNRIPNTNGETVVTLTGIAAANIDGLQIPFAAVPGKRYAITQVMVHFVAVANSGGDGVFTIERVLPGTAIGSGVDIHVTAPSPMSANGFFVDDDTINAGTWYTFICDETEGAAGKNIVEGGERLYLEAGGTLTSLAGGTLVITLRELPV